MKTLTLIIAGALLLAGCASFEEAYYVDREYGQASMASWDQQIAYPDYRFANKAPVGSEGITAEKIMDVYNNTFAEPPKKQDVFQIDLTGENNGSGK